MARADFLHADLSPSRTGGRRTARRSGDLADVPREARVAIVGAGYAGLATALELARHGVEAVVLERGALGVGASTRNGGSVSGGVNVGKSFSGRAAEVDPERANRLLSDASDAFSLIERLIEEERIECFWQKRGRFVGAWTPRHYAAQEKRLRSLNDAAQSGASMVPRERQRDEIASDYYYGGMVVERSASLHPALYYKGLLDACRRRDIPICAEASVEKIARNGAGWRVETSRGAVVGRRCRDRHQRLYRRDNPGAAPPGRADRQPHHRDRDVAARTGGVADPEAAQDLRYQARPLLLPAVARWHPHGVRRPGAVHPGRSLTLRAGVVRLHDRAVSAAEGHAGDA